MDSVSDADSPSFDEMVEALTDIQRRRLLIGLHEQDGDADAVLSIDDLQSEFDALSRSLKMEHGHLPKVEDCGLIEHDRDDEVVEPGPAFNDIEPLLDALIDLEDDLPPDVV